MCRNSDISMLIAIAGDFFNDKDFSVGEFLIDDLPSGQIVDGRDDLAYLHWGTESVQYIKTYFPSHYKNVHNIFYHQPIKHHKKIWMLLITLENYEPEPITKSAVEEKNQINIHQYQSNQNVISFNLLLEEIKNEISNDQLEELKNVLLDKNKDKEFTRSKIIEKIKSFGGDVASNILANILTNPNIYTAL